MKAKIKNRRPHVHTFFSLLVRNFLIFTLVLVLAAVALFSFNSWQFSSLVLHSEPEDILKYEKHLIAGEYGRLPVKKLFGSRSSIEVLDANGVLLYSSGVATHSAYTPGELACIPLDSRYVYREVLKYDLDQKHAQTVVADYRYTGDGFQSGRLLVVDDTYKVVIGESPTGNTQLTKSEYELLTHSLPDGRTVQQMPFHNAKGEPLTLLFYLGYASDAEFTRAARLQDLAVYSFLALYVILVAIFILWMNQKVKRPMQQLNHAIVAFDRGGAQPEPLNTGPAELVQINESFCELSHRLTESEAQRCKLEAGRQKMLADISHDLKTPITVIQGYSKAICDGLIPEDKKEQYLMTIYHKSTLLNDLINTFYEYSKLDHPDFRVNLERCDLCEYAREYLAAKYSEIDLAGFSLEIEIPDEPVYCNIDRMALHRVFENLIVNSIKHNPKGTTIYFSISPLAKHVIVTVADNGVGIPEEIANALFDPFVVGDDSRNNRQGSGLGLAISKKVAQAHGGSICLVSKPHLPYITQFDLTLPLT